MFNVLFNIISRTEGYVWEGRGMCVEGVLWMGMCGEGYVWGGVCVGKGYVWERGMCVGKEYMFGPNVLCSLDCVSNGLSEGTVTLHGVYTNSDYPMHVLLAPNEAMKLS